MSVVMRRGASSLLNVGRVVLVRVVLGAICLWGDLSCFHVIYESESNTLLAKRQNVNTSPGLGRGRVVPSSNKGSEFRYAVVQQFSRGDERIREVIPVPDSLGKEAFL